jgi:hypothetical protein
MLNSFAAFTLFRADTNRKKKEGRGGGRDLLERAFDNEMV